MNSYTTYTANDSVPMTKEQVEELNELLQEGGADDDASGCGVEYFERDGQGMGYLFAEECGNADGFSDEFLRRMGEHLTAAGMPHLTVGMAFTCSKTCEQSHGGGEFRIYADGELEYAELVYARDREVRP